MGEEDDLGRLEIAVEEIANELGADISSYEEGGRHLVSMERADDPVIFVRGEGSTKAAALNDLIRSAQNQGLAEKR